MTPRAYWDRDGCLLEENPDNPAQVRYIWAPNWSACRPRSEWGGSYGGRVIVEWLHGPLIGAA